MPAPVYLEGQEEPEEVRPVDEARREAVPESEHALGPYYLPRTIYRALVQPILGRPLCLHLQLDWARGPSDQINILDGSVCDELLRFSMGVARIALVFNVCINMLSI